MSSKPEIEPPTMLNEPAFKCVERFVESAFFLRFPVFVRNKHTKRFGSVFINSNNAAIVSAYVGKHCELEIVAEFSAFHKAPRIHGFLPSLRRPHRRWPTGSNSLSESRAFSSRISVSWKLASSPCGRATFPFSNRDRLTLLST